MSAIRVALFGFGVGLFAAGASCGGASATCDASFCASGCCDSTGACRPGGDAAACGSGAQMCMACGVGQTCMLGVCRSSGTSDAGIDAGTHVGVNDAGSMVGEIVINEIAARGFEFIELFNRGNGVAALASYGITDSFNDGGLRPDHTLRFPSGTSLAAGAYLVIALSRDDAGVTTDCPSGVSSCFETDFGVSDSRGERVWLVAPNDSVVASEEYPQNAAMSGMSWSRLPNGTGAFSAAMATPGAANQP